MPLDSAAGQRADNSCDYMESEMGRLFSMAAFAKLAVILLLAAETPLSEESHNMSLPAGTIVPHGERGTSKVSTFSSYPDKARTDKNEHARCSLNKGSMETCEPDHGSWDSIGTTEPANGSLDSAETSEPKHGSWDGIGTTEPANGSLDSAETSEPKHGSWDGIGTTEPANGSLDSAETSEPKHGSWDGIGTTEPANGSLDSAETSEPEHGSWDGIGTTEPANGSLDSAETSEPKHGSWDGIGTTEPANGALDSTVTTDPDDASMKLAFTLSSHDESSPARSMGESEAPGDYFSTRTHVASGVASAINLSLPSVVPETDSALQEKYNSDKSLSVTTLDARVTAQVKRSENHQTIEGSVQPVPSVNSNRGQATPANAETSNDGPDSGTLSLGFTAHGSVPKTTIDTTTTYDPFFGVRLDERLTFTCRGRCGLEISFPCGCSPVCVVYGTCCDDMALDCPQVLEEGWSRFGHLVAVDIICGENFVSQIASCPRAAGDGGSRQDNGPMGTVRSQGHENGGENNSTEFASTSSGVRHHAFQSGLIQGRKALGKNSSDLNLLSENVPRVDAESNQTTIDKFNNALLMAALVTDAETGFTFVNKSIYDCHRMSGDSFHLWSLRLEYRYASPLNLEDLEPLLNFNSMYMPMFNEKLLIPHLCIQNVIRNCSEVFDAELPDGNYKEKCENSSSLVISTGGKTRTYANRFCAYCNEGYHDRLRLEKTTT